jgi:arylsulfatase A-like enzyme
MKATLTLLCLILSQFSMAQKQPNVVFILADDLGYHDLGYSGSTFYETSNINALAARSMNFINGYAASRVCSPSRAAIMSGKSPARIGITDWIGAKTGTAWREQGRADKLLPPSYFHNLPQEDITMAEAFKAADYTTFFAGKWHLGGEGSYPENHGFDVNVGGYHAGSPFGGYFSPYNNPKMADGPNTENLSLRLAQETVGFIKENKDKPFFAFLSFYAVHGPIQTTEEKWNKYQKKAKEAGIKEQGFKMERVLPIRQNQDNPVYAGLLETMDEAIGLVLKNLKDLGLDENTIVVFTSDNGGVASGDAFSTSNAPLRGGKGYQWEGGVKEPYLIHVPWMNQNQKKISTPVVGMDFYPTLLELSGLEALPKQHVDGRSLVADMKGERAEDRDLFWHYPHYGNQGGEPSSIIRHDNWKLIHYWETGRSELYNLKYDPKELKDRSQKKERLKDNLFANLENWLVEVKAKIPEIDPDYTLVKKEQVLDRNVEVLWPRLEAERKRMLSEEYQPNPDWWGSKITDD